jgi:hypothetical protein
LTLALEDCKRAQDELVEARNRLARAIAGAAMSGMTKDEIVELTGYPAGPSAADLAGRQRQRGFQRTVEAVARSVGQPD